VTRTVAAVLALAWSVAGAVSAVSAQGNRFDYDDDAVRGLRYAAWEAGSLLGSAATPYSVADMRLAHARASAGRYSGSSSPEALSALKKIMLRIEEPAVLDALEMGASIRAVPGLEAYPRLYDDGGLPSPWSWSDRTALLALPVEFRAFDVVYARGVVELREEHNAIERAVEPANWSNWIESGDFIDYAFPFESFVAVEYGPLSLSLGRDKLRWGAGATGTLVLSDEADYCDYIDAGLTGERFSYRFTRLSIDPAVTASELEDLPDSFISAKNLFLHRFEFLVGGRLALALVEGLMVGGVEPDLAYANPFLVLHNRWAWNATGYDGLPDNNLVSASSVLGLELRVNPWRYMELYGSFAMNQFQTSYELDRFAGAADAIPNAYAWQAGGDAAFPFLGGWLRATVEYVFTNPWMYVRENRLNSFSWRRVLPTNVAGGKTIEDAPLGYRYGPDARVVFAAAGWDAPGLFSFMASAEYARRGEQTILSSYAEGPDALALSTPSGTPEDTTSLGLEVSWNPRAGISLYGAVSLQMVENAGHVVGASASALDALLGFSVSFPEAWRPGRPDQGMKD